MSDTRCEASCHRMHLTLVGLSHKTAPVEIREKLTFPANRQEEALSLLTSTPAVNEAVIVSTCNRTEIYAVTASEFDGPERRHRLHRRLPRPRPPRAGPLPLHLGGRGGRPPPLPRRGVARLDGAGRGADPRAGEGGLRALLRQRRAASASSTSCSARASRSASACAPRPRSARTPSRSATPRSSSPRRSSTRSRAARSWSSAPAR